MKLKKKVTYKMGGKMDKKKSKGITYEDGGKMEYGYGGKIKYAYGGKKKAKYNLGGVISAQDTKPPHEEILSQLQSDPRKFYERLSSDENFQKEVGSMFQGDVLDSLSNARTSHFASRGKAIVSSPEIEELREGRRVESLEDYQDLVSRYEGVKKIVRYDDSDEDDKIFNNSIKLINKLSNKYRPKPEVSEEEQRQLMEMMNQY